ncbi:54S ribosomal protein L51, mitochondrial [Balamuthia mandrillaris]
MSRNGIWQMKRLIVQWCDWGGSSRGVREFLKTQYPAFAERNPQIEAEAVLRRGRHPHLIAEYINGRRRKVCVKNVDPLEVTRVAQYLRDQWGGKNPKGGARPVYTSRPSVQGIWNPFLNIQ